MTGSDSSNDWTSLLRRAGCPVLYYSLIISAYEDERSLETTLLRVGFRDHKYLDGFVLFAKQRSLEIEAEFRSVLAPEYVAYYTQRCRQEARLLMRRARWLREASERYASEGVAAVALGGYILQAITTMTFLTSVVILERVLEAALDERVLLRHGEIDDAMAVLRALKFPRRKTLPSRAMKLLLEIARDVAEAQVASGQQDAIDQILRRMRSERPALLQRIDRFVERFDFVNMEYYVGAPLNATNVLELAIAMAPRAGTRLAANILDARRAQREYMQAVRTIRDDVVAMQLTRMLAEVHNVRQYRSDALMKAGRDAWPYLAKVAAGLGVTYSELLTLTWSELLTSMVKGAITVEYSEIEQRSRRYGISLSNGVMRLVTGEELDRELEAVGAGPVPGRTLVGKTVSPGRYEGPVKRVLVPADMVDVGEGDVVVSPMVDPYYLGAISKAGAIVTDEGGILNHAAIICREMNIPGVVGVRDATRVLRDGMRVTVDATEDIGVISVQVPQAK